MNFAAASVTPGIIGGAPIFTGAAINFCDACLKGADERATMAYYHGR